MNPRELVDMRAGAAGQSCGAELRGGVRRQPCGRQDVLGSLPPEAASPAGLTSIHPTGETDNSANFAITAFSEVPQSPNFVRCSTYISLIQEYAAFVAWPAEAA
jgi:hypothetical protein